MAYAAPLREIEFTLSAMAGADALGGLARFAEAGPDLRAAVLGEAAKLCEGALAPANAAGDAHGARLENGVVRTAPGFAAAHAALAEGGWYGVAADAAHGGMGLPHAFWCAANEMISGANLAFSMCPLLTVGHIEALEAHAPDWIRALYLPKLTSGRWTGTMCLTEPQAGSDVGALTTRAASNDDGTFAITGQKIYITWGDHDVAENVSHLVLARTPGAPEGAAGISLFLAPKFIPGADGAPGERNRIKVLSLERKLGVHGSPTCTMAFEGATAWLIGEENRGLAAMFTMMNNARLSVAMQGVGLAGAATAMALGYARERRQGRTPNGAGPIVEHAEVRRMLATMCARTAAARAVAYACAVAGDMGRAEDAPGRAGWAARAAFLTPIAKAFCTDVGFETASLNVQVHGGMGYIEDAGAAQLLRDARIPPIYEGTNGIQALDLVGRKLADGGEAARALLAEMAAGSDAPALAEARAALAATTDWMLAAGREDRAAGAAPYLRAWALTFGAHLMARGAAADPSFAPLSAVMQTRELPAVSALCREATDGAAALEALPLSDAAAFA
ncbi:acyl-CoA dehydrogenase family protein [Rubrimonas cliftonensis]|uniref:3-methylmercaptopropionyl-CoA dehydrogenase n=1 Tax=Rubrimonas cliftonensis TaxID=89524 RepID=A0A1H3Z597_9RHOB|nr:acyl-CoA dehydrogenase family protein [Rubrimonas cliftonensis]SEA18564.1 hypothetical protein SAMN05444370_103386 [Rubrimonas cliftonensis]